MYGLSIHLQSFYLNRNLVQSNDKISVSITTVPEENKEAFIVDADKTKNIHHFFTVNISNQTKRIIFVFRKKSLFGSNHIVASTVLPINDLPQSENDKKNTEMKNIKIYEPFQHMNNNVYAIQNRKIFGEMEIQFIPTKVFPVTSIKDNYNNYKNKTNNKYQMNFLSVNASCIFNPEKDDENKYQCYDLNNNQILFIDQLTNMNINEYKNENQFNSFQDQNQEQKYLEKNFKPQNQMIFVDDLI